MEAHPVLSGVAVGPFMRHAVREGDVDESEARARQHRRRGVGGAACLDDDPGERVRHVAEGVEEAGEVERLERTGVGRGDDKHLPGLLDAVPAPLLLLHALHDPVRAHHLDGVRVRPRPDPNPVPPHHDVALRVPRRRRPLVVARRLQRGAVSGAGRGSVGGGEGEREGVGGRRRGCRRCGGSRGGAQDRGRGGRGGGVVERGGGEEQEEEEPREAEAEEERDEAAERVEQEPEGGGGRRPRARAAAVGHSPVSPRCAAARRRPRGRRRRAPQLALRQQRLHHSRRIWWVPPAARRSLLLLLRPARSESIDRARRRVGVRWGWTVGVGWIVFEGERLVGGEVRCTKQRVRR